MTFEKKQTQKETRPVGRPPLEMPEQIPDTPENIARIIMATKPKKRDEWRFIQEHEQANRPE